MYDVRTRDPTRPTGDRSIDPLLPGARLRGMIRVCSRRMISTSEQSLLMAQPYDVDLAPHSSFSRREAS